eukprot:TRINITY_DN31066_c0_g1_i1.p1 TRINITY_DN31066_c0_g1~~TRINITY_DN31066_c0_g1_i1.p1  ORF type:complete len:422 (-),score=118.81 TRINITY_DN31066_c0_g1_i1:127-1392(-)
MDVKQTANVARDSILEQLHTTQDAINTAIEAAVQSAISTLSEKTSSLQTSVDGVPSTLTDSMGPLLLTVQTSIQTQLHTMITTILQEEHDARILEREEEAVEADIRQLRGVSVVEGRMRGQLSAVQEQLLGIQTLINDHREADALEPVVSDLIRESQSASDLKLQLLNDALNDVKDSVSEQATQGRNNLVELLSAKDQSARILNQMEGVSSSIVAMQLELMQAISRNAEEARALHEQQQSSSSSAAAIAADNTTPVVVDAVTPAILDEKLASIVTSITNLHQAIDEIQTATTAAANAPTPSPTMAMPTPEDMGIHLIVDSIAALRQQMDALKALQEETHVAAAAPDNTTTDDDKGAAVAADMLESATARILEAVGEVRSNWEAQSTQLSTKIIDQLASKIQALSSETVSYTHLTLPTKRIV